MRPLGPYTTGEVPEPLTVTFLGPSTLDGDPIDLSGYDAVWLIQPPAGEARSATAEVAADQDTNRGEVTYTWVDGDFEESGNYRAEMWVDNGVTRLCSELFSFHVRPAIATPAFGS